MTRIVARRARDLYSSCMTAMLLRIALTFALLLMPFGMAAAPAAAASAAPAVSEHCGEHRPQPESPGEAKIHCTGCAALPVIDAPVAADVLPPHAPDLLALASLRSAVEPDIATPPPKRS